MTNVQPIAFTLWGQGFDEIAAAAFMGELRRLGLRAQTVGLNMQQTGGRNGLVLRPDLTLDQALSLVQHATCAVGCVIVPGTIAHLQQFGYDPRLAELLQRTAAARAIFVVAQSQAPPAPSLCDLQRALPDALIYPADDINAFVRGVLVPQLDLRRALS